MLDLVFNNFTSDKTPGGSSLSAGRQFFYSLLQKAAKATGLPSGTAEISINLVGEAGIRRLNGKYRNKNKVTDVLSFPLDAGQTAKNGIIPLGDIFICLPFAKKQAKRENISVEEKLSRLAAHGFLHLLGYDHEKSERDGQKMKELEKLILGGQQYKK